MAAMGRKLPLRRALLQPTFRSIPIRGLSQARVSLDLRSPQRRRWCAFGFDNPVAVGEIGGAVGGELGLFAAEQLVGPGGKAEKDPRRGDDRWARADGIAERACELAVSPAASFAVVVVLPTPPFWFAIAETCPMAAGRLAQ